MAHFEKLLIVGLIIQCLDNTLCDTNNATKDANIARMVHEYKLVCPDEIGYTCDTTAFINATVSPINRVGLPPMFSRLDSCCRSCNCKPECGSHCCPDQQDIRFELQTLVQPRKECIYAQYRPFESSSLNGYSLLMINKCPSNFSGRLEIETRCNRATFDVDLNDGIDIVPVSSMVSNNTYKNWMCALCHGEVESNLLYSETRYMCKVTMSLVVPETLEQMGTSVRNVRNCNILFFPAINDVKCDRIIDTCNVTGKWDTYDPFTEIACSLYESVYDNTYKNVHCFFCNQAHNTSVETQCLDGPSGIRGHALTALLDFNKLSQSNTHTDVQGKCPADHFYDQLKGICRLLVCNRGFIYKQEECTPMFEELTGTGVTVIFSFALSLTHHNASEKLNITHTKTMLTQTLQRATAMNLQVCNTISYVRLKTNITTLVYNMVTANRSIIYHDVEYIALVIQLKDRSVSDVSKRVKELVNLLRSISLFEFQVTSRNISDLTLSNVVENFGNASLHNNFTKELELLNMPHWLLASLRDAYDDDDIGVVPLYPLMNNAYVCKTTFLITSNVACPRLMLPNADFEQGVDSIYIASIRKNVSYSHVSLSEQGDYLSICLDEYKSLILNYIHTTQNRNSFTPLTILTIVCSSLSLVSLVTTLIIYVTLSSLRTLPGLNNIGLICSLIVFLSLSLVNAVVGSMPLLVCRIVGVSLHFSLMSSFSWMLVCTFHMARVFAHISERPLNGNNRKVFLQYVLLTNTISVITVVATVVICYLSSDGKSIGYSDNPCYVEANILIYNVVVPVGLVIVLNLTIFAYVVITISRIDDLNKNTSHERSNLIIFAKLSTLTGLTWIFGFVYQFTSVEVFAYLFTIINSSQGVFIMWSFVLNKRVYNMLTSKKETFTSASMVTNKTTATTPESPP